MTLNTVAEHTYAPALLQQKSNILDLGCRGMQFTNHFRQFGHVVYPVDVDLLEGLVPQRDYIRCAITGEVLGRVGIARKPGDPQATKVVAGDDIFTHTVESFSALIDVPFWDLIKIDIEGSELDVIRSLRKPPARQLSIEFHLHTGVYGLREMITMEKQLDALGYKAIKHEKYKAHGCSENYWDSLFVLSEGK
jgi:hypothetical protein